MKKNWNLIACIGNNGELGKDGHMIWNVPEDLKRFKELTSNGIVIMGRKTWESIPSKYKPLSNRINIVVSSNFEYKSDDINNSETNNYSLYVINTKDKIIDVVERYKEYKNVWVIGGIEIYKMFEDKYDKLFITHVCNNCLDADTYFPIDLTKWKSENIKNGKTTINNNVNYTFIDYIRKDTQQEKFVCH